MFKVNITPKTLEIAEKAGLYVQHEDVEIIIGDLSYTREVISIGEESSDFLVEYLINSDGTLTHRMSPCYIEDLPVTIFDSVGLRRVVAFLAETVETFLIRPLDRR